MKMNFTLAVAPPFVHPMTSLLATPTHFVRKNGFFSKPTPRRQVAKYGNLNCCESLSFLVTQRAQSILNFNPLGSTCMYSFTLCQLQSTPCGSCSRERWHCSCVEFKREMSKTQLWWFKFGISVFYGNLSQGWDESSVVHRIPIDQIKLFTLPIVD